MAAPPIAFSGALLFRLRGEKLLRQIKFAPPPCGNKPPREIFRVEGSRLCAVSLTNDANILDNYQGRELDDETGKQEAGERPSAFSVDDG